MTTTLHKTQVERLVHRYSASTHGFAKFYLSLLSKNDRDTLTDCGDEKIGVVPDAWIYLKSQGKFIVFEVTHTYPFGSSKKARWGCFLDRIWGALPTVDVIEFSIRDRILGFFTHEYLCWYHHMQGFVNSEICSYSKLSEIEEEPHKQKAIASAHNTLLALSK